MLLKKQVKYVEYAEKKLKKEVSKIKKDKNMDFKKTTLLAYIGSLLMLTASIIWTVSGIINNVDYKLFDLIPSPIISLLSLIGEIFIVIFFYSLYKKQK